MRNAALLRENSEYKYGGKMDNLLERAFLFLESGEFKKADEYLEKVLDSDCKNARAYLGKLMIERKVCKVEDLVNCSKLLKEYNEEKAKEEKYIKAGELYSQGKIGESLKLYMEIYDYKDSVKKINCKSKRISAGEAHLVGLKSDGTVIAVGNNKYGQCDVENWDLF